MSQSTVKRARSRARAAEPVDTRKFATRTSIMEEDWLDIELPNLQQWVRVSILDSIQVAQLAVLPDMLEFSTLVAQLAPEEETQVDDQERVDTAVKNYTYLSVLAHLAVRDPEKTTVVKCPDPQCGMKHEVSLWSVRQCRRLHPQDLLVISDTALSKPVVEVVAPFSEESTGSDTPQPADTGE